MHKPIIPAPVGATIVFPSIFIEGTHHPRARGCDLIPVF